MMTTVNVMRDGEIVTVDATEYPEPGVNLAKIRAATTIPMVDFMEALLDAGEITEAEFTAWADGTVPTSVDADLAAALSGADLTKARARVVKSTNVNRMNSLVILLQNAPARNLTDEQVDAFFGIGT
jgi:hypothetical protein